MRQRPPTEALGVEIDGRRELRKELGRDPRAQPLLELVEVDERLQGREAEQPRREQLEVGVL